MMATVCCSPFGLVLGLLSMATPLLAIGAILYLVFTKPKYDPSTKGI